MVMRLAMIVLAASACTAEIAPGAYLCGPEQLCPEGLACNGTDNTCVLASEALPFACGVADPAGDDVPTAGQVVANLACVSPIRESKGCLLQNDIGDWYQFDVPGNCAAVQIEARITFPIAFEQVAMQLSTDDGPGVAVDGPCSSALPPDLGDTARCFKMTVANGSHHAIGLVHSGLENCGGGCANNRYTLSLQLSTP
jgi:hypothetical protein